MSIIQLLIFQVIIFIGLVVIVRHLMGRHATTATAHLQGLTQDYLKKQEEMKKRLEDAERHYQELLAKAQHESQELKNQAIKEMDEKRQKLLEEARQEAERIVKQAVSAKDSLYRELQSSLEKQAVEKACELIQAVLPGELQEETHIRWLDQVLENGMLHMEHLEMPEPVEEVHVVSARPLTAAQKGKLLGKLRTSLGYPVTLQEKVDPKIIAGLTITLGHLVLDGSLVSKLQEAARHAQNSEK